MNNRTRSAPLPKAGDPAVVSGSKFLEQASQTLLGVAPALAAYLGQECNALLSAGGIRVSEEQKRRCCQACGNTMIPGFSCKTRRITPQQKKKHGEHRISKPSSTDKSVSKATIPGRVIYECDMCHSTTHLPYRPKGGNSAELRSNLPATRKSQNTEAPIPASFGATPTTSAPNTAPPSPRPGVDSGSAGASDASTGSKKRARKSQKGGLAALLAKSKAASASPAAFDLMDFMKTA